MLLIFICHYIVCNHILFIEKEGYLFPLNFSLSTIEFFYQTSYDKHHHKSTKCMKEIVI